MLKWSLILTVLIKYMIKMKEINQYQHSNTLNKIGYINEYKLRLSICVARIHMQRTERLMNIPCGSWTQQLIQSLILRFESCSCTNLHSHFFLPCTDFPIKPRDQLTNLYMCIFQQLPHHYLWAFVFVSQGLNIPFVCRYQRVLPGALLVEIVVGLLNLPW